MFRGRFCDILLRDRVPAPFDEDAVVYDLGETQRALWFVRRGVVKVGTITADGREIIYDVRKEGDVVGELCAFEPVRRDRAVVVERADLVSVAFHDAMDALSQHPAALQDFVEVFGGALAEAYDQLNSLANDDVMQRLREDAALAREQARRGARRAGRDRDLSDAGRARADGDGATRKSFHGAQHPASARRRAVLAARTIARRHARSYRVTFTSDARAIRSRDFPASVTAVTDCGGTGALSDLRCMCNGRRPP